jgi:hypothetical protein
MTRSDELLDRLRADPQLAALLDGFPLEFDLTRLDHVEPVRMASGLDLEATAGTGSGGTFFLVGDAETERPVLYADSEGQAGLIAADLAEALTLELVLPYWGDSLSSSAGGDLETMLRYAPDLERSAHDDDPDLAAARNEAARALEFDPLPPLEAVVRKLHAAVSMTEPDYLLVFDDPDYGPQRYESLLGRTPPEASG